MTNPAYEATNSDVEKLIAPYESKFSRLWERFDEACHGNAEHMRDILEATLNALEGAESDIAVLTSALEQAQQDGKEKSSSKEGFIEADRFKIPPMPEKVSAYDMRETLNVPMFEEEAQASANGFNQCLLEFKPIHEAAKRMSRGIDELLKEMDAMQENINHKQKTISILRDRSESAEKHIAELESAPNGMMQLSNELAEMKRKCVELPDEFARIGENLRTQDNRVTSDPMFCVFQKREIVTNEDYNHDRIVWIDEDGNEATTHQRRRLELLHENSREAPEKWRRIAVKEINDFVTCCFTEQGCKDYLACNGHNLRLPFIYVKSGFRNAEYQTVRNWLMTVGTVEGSE